MNKLTRTYHKKIWQLKVNELSNILAVELRDKTNTQSSIEIINLKNFEVFEIDYNQKIRNDATLIAIYENIIVLGYFSKNGFPSYEKIMGYDYIKKNIVLEKEGSLFCGFNSHTNLEFINKNKENEKQIIDISNFTNKFRNIKLEMYFPTIFKEGQQYYNDFKHFLAYYNFVPLGDIEYLEQDENIIMSFLIQKDLLLKKIIWLRESQLILDSDIDQPTYKIMGESFFIFNQKLIFISNQKSLNIYEI